MGFGGVGKGGGGSHGGLRAGGEDEMRNEGEGERITYGELRNGRGRRGVGRRVVREEEDEEKE